jgi:hypothetical protein
MFEEGETGAYMKCIRPVVLIGFSSLFCLAIISAPRQSVGQRPEVEESKFIKPESIQGCYDLGTLSWKPDLKLGEDETFITPPQRIQILAERGSVGFEKNGYLVRPAPGFSKSIHRASYWESPGPRTIEIVFTTGFSGLSMKLKVEGETLRGEAKTHWDFPRRKQTAQVNAHRTECGNSQ